MRSQVWWQRAATIAFIFAGVVVTLILIWTVIRPVALFVAAVVLAQAAAPPVHALERRMPRGVAVGLIYAAGLLILGGLGWIVVPHVAQQATDFIQSIPSLLTDAAELIERIDPIGGGRLLAGVESLFSSNSENGMNIGATLSTVPMTIISSFLEIILVVVGSAYWLIAAPSMTRFFLSLFPEERRERTAEMLDEMGMMMGGYVRAFLIDAVIVGAISYVGLSLLGVQYAGVLAVLAGVGEIVPVAGPILAGMLATGMALTQSPGLALAVAIFYMVLQQVESNLLMPLVVKNQADIPPVLVLFALVVGATLVGVLGALVAVPVAGALRVLTLRLLAPLLREWTGAANGPQPLPAESSATD